MSSYHTFVLSVGQNGVERVYVEDTEQGREAAEKTLKRSQRNRVIGYRLSRPSSYYAAEREAREAAWPAKLAAAQERLGDSKRRRFRYRQR